RLSRLLDEGFLRHELPPALLTRTSIRGSDPPLTAQCPLDVSGHGASHES
ncbi:MAG: hypothetical protein HW416_3702, partial [Chloroflexi bacterium]|nr:hypothetical protein [Chloroflexota bacterium]